MGKIMALNAGSSSVKFRLLEMPSEVVVASGVAERLNTDKACYTFKYNESKVEGTFPSDKSTHGDAVKKIIDLLLEHNIVKSLSEIEGVGHRIVQGGDYFNQSVVINDYVKDKIKELIPLAPLHNPAHLAGIKAIEELLPNVPSVAVFDTAFHQTMDELSYMYAVPYEWYKNYKVKKYGAHGTSHQYVSKECARIMNKPIEDLKIITCHIGNGASITAIKGGKCVDTTMGLTPLDGIPMGTRSGAIDPTVLEYMNSIDPEKYNIKELLKILNNFSGYKGVSGVSHDSRDLEEQYDTNPRCKLALDLQYKRIADYIGSYYVLMGGVDAIVFTAGIGENSSLMRKSVLDRIAVLGVEIDNEANENCKEKNEITTKTSKIKAFVIPTDEELVIARDVIRLTK